MCCLEKAGLKLVTSRTGCAGVVSLQVGGVSKGVLCPRLHIELCLMTHQWARRCFFIAEVSALGVFFAWTPGRGNTCTAPSY